MVFMAPGITEISARLADLDHFLHYGVFHPSPVHPGRSALLSHLLPVARADLAGPDRYIGVRRAGPAPFFPPVMAARSGHFPGIDQATSLRHSHSFLRAY